PAVETLPDAAIERIPIPIERNDPDVHLISSGERRDFGAINWAAEIIRRGNWRAGRRGERAIAWLVRQPRPIHAVGRRIKSVIANRGQKYSLSGIRRRVINNRRRRHCVGGLAAGIEQRIVGPVLPS